MTSNFRVVQALVRRALNEIARVPGAAIPGVLAPTIFMLGMSSIFGRAGELEAYGGVEFKTFIFAVGFLQAAAFTGAATGVNLARDIEQGWFDRLLVTPVPRSVLLLGIVSSAALRALLPATFLLFVGLLIGVDWPGVDGLALLVLLAGGYAMVAACWGAIVALRFRTQQAAPIMQVGSFTATLFTTAYAPLFALQDWLQKIAEINPVTEVLEGIRQGFVGDVTWGTTWPALLALAGLLAFFGLLALRGMRRADA